VGTCRRWLDIHEKHVPPLLPLTSQEVEEATRESKRKWWSGGTGVSCHTAGTGAPVGDGRGMGARERAGMLIVPFWLWGHIFKFLPEPPQRKAGTIHTHTLPALCILKHERR